MAADQSLVENIVVIKVLSGIVQVEYVLRSTAKSSKLMWRKKCSVVKNADAQWDRMEYNENDDAEWKGLDAGGGIKYSFQTSSRTAKEIVKEQKLRREQGKGKREINQSWARRRVNLARGGAPTNRGACKPQRFCNFH